MTNPIDSRKRVIKGPDIDCDPYEGRMQFRLTYEGPLPATNIGRDPNKPTRSLLKHQIRQTFQKQLRALWEERPFLSRMFTPFETGKPSYVDEMKAVHGGWGYGFVPLATEASGIDCRLDILLLRPGAPGGVIHAGDIDNRLKTLFDALRKPRNGNEVPEGASPGQDEDPFFVLLEDDSLISRVTLETDTMLEPVSGNADDVRLVIGVDVRSTTLTIHPLRFL